MWLVEPWHDSWDVEPLILMFDWHPWVVDELIFDNGWVVGVHESNGMRNIEGLLEGLLEDLLVLGRSYLRVAVLSSGPAMMGGIER